MASSASNLSLLVQSQSGKEATANALWNAMSQAALFSRYSSSGLIWFYYGGTMIVDGVITQIANNTTTGVTLSASATNYIEADRSGTVTKNTTGFTPDESRSIPPSQTLRQSLATPTVEGNGSRCTSRARPALLLPPPM